MRPSIETKVRALESAVAQDDWPEVSGHLKAHGVRLAYHGYAHLVNEALDALPAAAAWDPAVVFVRGCLLDIQGRGQDALDTFGGLLELAPRTLGPERRSEILCRIARCKMAYGGRVDVASLTRQSASVAQRAPHLWNARTRVVPGGIRLLQGGAGLSADRQLRDGYRMAARTGYPELYRVSASGYALDLLGHGDLERAAGALRVGVRRMALFGTPYDRLHLLMNLALVYTLAGCLESAFAVLDDAMPLQTLFGGSFAAIALDAVRFMLVLEQHDLSEAERLRNALRGIPLPFQIRAWIHRTEVLFDLALNRLDEAWASAVRMMAALREVGIGGFFAPECLLTMARLCHARREAAAPWAVEALRIAQREGLAFWVKPALTMLKRLGSGHPPTAKHRALLSPENRMALVYRTMSGSYVTLGALLHLSDSGVARQVYRSLKRLSVDSHEAAVTLLHAHGDIEFFDTAGAPVPRQQALECLRARPATALRMESDNDRDRVWLP
ncbi:MAG TPA: hypothetical protein VGO93_01200 [Candidatus Xenobia bacterium]